MIIMETLVITLMMKIKIQLRTIIVMMLHMLKPEDIPAQNEKPL